MVRQASGRHGWPVDRAADRQAQADARLALGAALRSLRRSAGFTQEQVAHVMGVKPNKVSVIENGRTGLRWYTVLRYLAGVNATFQQLADELEKTSATADDGPVSSAAGSPSGHDKTLNSSD